ncbi:efflux RND transporter periplasmic adaptor subunit [Brevibacillus choshinensis]|uniref:Efflux RND transporter periplasmic adaptor subunit n=1 Tax=Brevibacillus choshinensis TaxID=54911 RepID=A0ABX7FXF4_BRECH|nr:efflux RND transporter periplasmic adaptor subunit [Brevibacillus choshinensis]
MAESDKKRMFFSKGRTGKTKWVALGLAVVLIGGGVYGYRTLMTPQRAQAAFQVEKVKKGDVSETVLASGTVQASKRSSLSFADAEDAKDSISSIKVSVGDQVKAGQVLATMDDSVAQIQVTNSQANLLSAEAKLEEAQKRKTTAEMKTLQANVNQTKSELELAKQGIDSQKASNDEAKAKANLANAQKTYASQKTLYEAGAISKTEYDTAQTDLDQAQRDYQTAILTAGQTKGESTSKVEQAQAAYDTAVEALNEANEGPDASTVLTAKAAVVQAKAQLQQAQKALSAVTLKAPMDGVIVAVNGNVGEIPGSDFIIMDNSNSGALEVLAQISQSDIGKVKEGQNVTYTTTSYPDQTFAGTVKLVYPEAKTDSGVTSYDVLLSVANKEGLLKIGMTMNVTIEIGSHQNVLVVPAQALQTQNGKDGVYLYAGASENNVGRPYRFQPVKIGYFASDSVEITEGLKEGDQIVLIANPTSASSSNNTNRMGGIPGMGSMGGGFPGGGGSGMRGR